MLMCDEFDLNSCYDELDEELEIVESSSSHRNSSERNAECEIVQLDFENKDNEHIDNEETNDDHRPLLTYPDSVLDSSNSPVALKRMSKSTNSLGKYSSASESSIVSFRNSSQFRHFKLGKNSYCKNQTGQNQNFGRNQSFICDVCHKGFALKKYLRQHELIHYGVRRFQCTICQQRFLRLGDLTRHYTIHSGERKYKCRQCDLSFTRKCYLNKHVVMHSEQFEVGSSESMSDSFQNIQNGSAVDSLLSQNNLTCDASGDMTLSESYRPLTTSCDQSLSENATTLQSSNIWLPDVSPNSQKPSILYDSSVEDDNVLFECNACDKMFTSKHYLRQHERVHYGKKNFECHICGERFPRMSTLKEHAEIHSPVKVEFNDAPEIKSTDDNQYLCDICGKGFMRKDSVKQHRVTHFNERLFECDLCPKTFVHSSSLYKHKLKHHFSTNSASSFC